MGWLDAVIGGVVSLGGALISSNANKSAAKAAASGEAEAARINAEAEEKARAEFRAAAARGIGAIRAGTDTYETTIRPMMVDPDQLTPTQQIGLDDLQRDWNAHLATSGLRGAGRAGAAAFFDATGRYTANAYDTNQQRADKARYGLATERANEGRAVANTEIGAGNQVGASFQSQGQAASEGASRSGEYMANAAAANGNIWGGALGTIGSIIADEVSAAKKQQARAI